MKYQMSELVDMVREEDINPIIPYCQMSQMSELCTKVWIRDILYPWIGIYKKDQLPTVISVKGCGNVEQILRQENHVYIGRHNKFVNGTCDSKWRNPFPISNTGRSDCLKQFEKYLQENADLINDLDELYRKTLVCWCVPNSCHGEILIQFCKEKLINRGSETH